MCFDCSPENLVGQFVQGNRCGMFQALSTTRDSIYEVEKVDYYDYGKLYDFCLKSLPDGKVKWIRNIRRGTFYNHFKHIVELPENMLEAIKWKVTCQRRYLRQYEKELKNGRKRMEEIGKIMKKRILEKA